MEGQKHDQGKPRYSLIPPKGMEEFVKVLTYGAEKYDDHNWKKVPDLQSRYYDALQRHVAAYRAGELVDGESGLPHLAHAMCCVAFMMEDSLNEMPPGSVSTFNESMDPPTSMEEVMRNRHE